MYSIKAGTFICINIMFSLTHAAMFASKQMISITSWE